MTKSAWPAAAIIMLVLAFFFLVLGSEAVADLYGTAAIVFAIFAGIAALEDGP